MFLLHNCPRGWRAWCKAEELRTEGLRKLRELEKLEQERAARRLELRRAGLSVLISRGAGLLGESFRTLDGKCEVGRSTFCGVASSVLLT